MRKKLLLLTTMALAGTLAFGQESDPPSLAARLGYLSGTVSFQPGSVTDWVPATLNRPLTTGDRLWTEAGARAELHTGAATLRLNGRTSFEFLNLNDAMTQIQISQGTLNVRLRRLDEQESFEIDTPQVAFSLLRPGEYRVDVNEQGEATVVTVRGGEGEATAGAQAFPIRARQQVRITGTGDGGQPTLDQRDAPVADGFDNFCQNRDRREDMSEAGRHVSRDMPGYADLDGYGAWREVPNYGWVWAPRVEVGWAPYHLGHWAWVNPWGWTWVDDAPWGYAPFHYGRWASVGGAWVWVPGPVAVRPVYAPALVAWVGGPRFSIGVSIGGGAAAVGWFPLAPGEVWVPAYRASPRYFNQVNVSNTVVNKNVNITNVYNNTYVNKNTTNVTNVTYANQNVNGAVAAVPQTAMVSGRPVSQAAVRVPPAAVQSAQIQQAAPVAPERAAVLGGRNATSAAPPAAAMNRTVVARATPAPRPVPFTQQQTALQSNPGRPLDRTTLNQIQSTQPVQPRAFVRQANPGPRLPNAVNTKQGVQPVPQIAQPNAVNTKQGVQPVPQIAQPNAVNTKQGGQPVPHIAQPNAVNTKQGVQPVPQIAPPNAVNTKQGGQPVPQVSQPRTAQPRTAPPPVAQPQLAQPQVAQPQLAQPQVRRDTASQVDRAKTVVETPRPLSVERPAGKAVENGNADQKAKQDTKGKQRSDEKQRAEKGDGKREER